MFNSLSCNDRHFRPPCVLGGLLAVRDCAKALAGTPQNGCNLAANVAEPTGRSRPIGLLVVLVVGSQAFVEGR